MRLACFALAVCLASCVRTEAVTCASGLTCPAGSICDDVQRRCISSEQIAACTGLSDGDACELAGVPGDCAANVCEPRYCGDGVQSGAEACDGNDLGDASCASLNFYGETTGLACRPDCTFDTRGCIGACGDQVRNGTEICDGLDLGTATCLDAGFYKPDGLRCSPFCTFDTGNCQERCGDGIKNGPELCDGSVPTETCIDIGRDAGTLACSIACGYTLDNCARFGWYYARKLPIGDVSAVHASSADDVWIVGSFGSAGHFDGNDWTSVDTGVSGFLVDVWTLGPDDAWAIEFPGNVLHWDGTAWTKDVAAPTDARVLYASAPDEVFVAGTSGVKRWNGTAWSDVGSAPPSGMRMIHGVAADDVWVTDFAANVWHWDGVTWESRPVGANMASSGLFASGPDEAWVVGGDADDVLMRAHWDAGQWSVTPSALGTANIKITGTAHNDIWILGEGAAEHFDGSTWLPVGVPDIHALFAIAAGHVLGLGNNDDYRFSGQIYASIPEAPVSSTFLTGAMYVSDGGHLFITDNGGGVWRYDGAWESKVASSGVVSALWGASESDVWGVGATGKPTHYDGSTWTEATIANTQSLRSITGFGTDEIWAGGYTGTVLHFDGTDWTNRDIAGITSSHWISTLTGSGPDDVWALSSNSGLYHWSGTWVSVTVPGTGTLSTIMSIGPGQVVAIRGVRAYHLNAGTWTEKELPFTQFGPFSLGASGPDDVFGVGQGNNIFHFDGTSWSLVRSPVAKPTTPAALSVKPGRVDIFFVDTSRYVRTLIRTRPWRCRADEVGHCADAVDNDCDGRLDILDADCL